MQTAESHNAGLCGKAEPETPMRPERPVLPICRPSGGFVHRGRTTQGPVKFFGCLWHV